MKSNSLLFKTEILWYIKGHATCKNYLSEYIMAQEKITPLMQQYFEIKAQYPDALLLFQVGDFYELFFDDAKKAAECLHITLTTRGTHMAESIPLCGVPIHSVKHYLGKLVRAGFKAALCDQLEPATPGIVVKRGVVRVLTPGTLTDDELLDVKTASYLCSFFPTHTAWGLIFGELLTAQLYATIIPLERNLILDAELARFFPDEILIPQLPDAKQFVPYFTKQGYYTSVVPFEHTEWQPVTDWVTQQFPPAVVQAFGTQQAFANALRTFHTYLEKHQAMSLTQFNKCHIYEPDDFLLMDANTQRHLELLKNMQDGGRNNTLCELIDQSATGAGSRMVKKWVVRPLVKKSAIEKRQEVVEQFVRSHTLSLELLQLLKQVGDLERVVGRIALQRGTMRDYIQLKRSLSVLPEVKKLLIHSAAPLLVSLLAMLGDFGALYELLVRALYDGDERDWIINAGFDAQLDQVRSLVHNSNQLILELEQSEQQATGIGSLKIRYNGMSGYYIEITKTHVDSIPDYYKKYQSLVGKERYITAELKELEQNILAAQAQSGTLEQKIFGQLKVLVHEYVHQLRQAAHALAHIDALLGFAHLAYNNGYVKPQFTESRDIIIKQGRHPVVEQHLGHRFIPNDTVLTDQESTWIITGPNMGGKSTFLRQVALMTIMGQCGSFVPAKSAQLALCDKIFTRIGASDNVAQGKSTFLVEMEETAHICANATNKSLVILDEVGRGTSTFDGLAIAQAVVEYVHATIEARCLFATHYHELSQLEHTIPGIVNYYAASRKTEQGMLLLYTILKGVADGSFGIEVAKAVQLPTSLVSRAQAILEILTQSEVHHAAQSMAVDVSHLDTRVAQLSTALSKTQEQLNYYKLHIASLEKLDINNLSPRQAFDLLWEFKTKQVNLP